MTDAHYLRHVEIEGTFVHFTLTASYYFLNKRLYDFKITQ